VILARREPDAAHLSRVALLVHALIHDLAAWMAGVEGPVTPGSNPSYRLDGVAALPSPRERLRRYVDPSILRAWSPAIAEWRALGHGYRPRFERRLQVHLSTNGGGPRAELLLRDQSTIESPDGVWWKPDRTWRLVVGFDGALDRIASIELRPDEPERSARPPR
jgi:hypothetical protein